MYKEEENHVETSQFHQVNRTWEKDRSYEGLCLFPLARIVGEWERSLCSVIGIQVVAFSTQRVN